WWWRCGIVWGFLKQGFFHKALHGRTCSDPKLYRTSTASTVVKRNHFRMAPLVVLLIFRKICEEAFWGAFPGMTGMNKFKKKAPSALKIKTEGAFLWKVICKVYLQCCHDFFCYFTN
ncbi:MAG: hypothetical protein KAI22_09270, partial [Gammaproteobacteria bacterium]|nr:hypothetical protein [Gammaproteobacteria bacterium]